MTGADPLMKTVLIVEDDPLLRELFSEVLSDSYSVLTAASVHEATRLFASTAVDAVISDFHLKGETSQSFLEMAYKQRPQLLNRTILLTGGDSRKLASHQIVLQKPINIMDLIHKTAALFECDE